MISIDRLLRTPSVMSGAFIPVRESVFCIRLVFSEIVPEDALAALRANSVVIDSVSSNVVITGEVTHTRGHRYAPVVKKACTIL